MLGALPYNPEDYLPKNCPLSSPHGVMVHPLCFGPSGAASDGADTLSTATPDDSAPRPRSSALRRVARGPPIGDPVDAEHCYCVSTLIVVPAHTIEDQLGKPVRNRAGAVGAGRQIIMAKARPPGGYIRSLTLAHLRARTSKHRDVGRARSVILEIEIAIRPSVRRGQSFRRCDL